MAADGVLDIESAMTTAQRRSAYARFVGLNPAWAGAYWADILGHLLDHDAHLDITEPLWDDCYNLPVDGIPFFTGAALSLFYANGEIPTNNEVVALAVAAARLNVS